MLTEWNPRVAAERFLELAKKVLGKENIDIFFDGPCSPARKIKDNWFNKIVK